MFVDYKKIENIVSAEVEKTMNNLIAGSLNNYLEELRDLISEEQELINMTARKTIERIKDPIKNLENIQSRFYLMQIENKKLIDEIRKRDAIIERKTKQLQKKIKNEV
ncbi:hypothetical protein MNB_SM-5-465 [hydrothermal vent metagenome]|uniref:Uncharacterized protein n=1 Tax=hydrothermal vent metagenome TaxID=652676 RepID=A0A1W1CYU5_9ZZZZ